ncbi:MAG: site-specific recombinase [Candidatus Scalindua rubra]|uniref:Site-specific recombinase n=1 Tax=Candidatus Scalindua rubra TaxID=1872076 RepID=A0A1E3XEA5_9BACT|nr:MAG: site-specific recombinase [Candidatus Scalindua rubra]
MAGVDLISIKELLGHKSLNMTLRYAHLSSGHMRSAVNKLDDILKISEQEQKDTDNVSKNENFVHNLFTPRPLVAVKK